MFVHGATYPSSAVFAPLGESERYSWLHMAARRGQAAFAVDLRGYRRERTAGASRRGGRLGAGGRRRRLAPSRVQIVGDRFAETDVLAASAAVERQRPWQDAYPELD